METPEKEIKTLFAWTEADDDNRAMLAFTIKVDENGEAKFENSINGRGHLLFEGLKALAQDNPDFLTIMSHVVAILSEDESPIIIN